MGSAFNLARGIQFFTPVAISLISTRYGLGDGRSNMGACPPTGGMDDLTFVKSEGLQQQ
jgi:hypothetical protein